MIDRSKLLALLGDEKMVDRAIDIFRSDVPGQLTELQAMVAAQDWSDASRIAHTIKSQCAYLGLDYAETLARTIEDLAEGRGDRDQIEALADLLDTTLSPYL